MSNGSNEQGSLFGADWAEMFCDGASRGNPGHAGIGVVVTLPDEAVRQGMNRQYRISEYIGIATNNVAEYTALIKGLEKVLALGVRHIRIFLDSELLVRQVKGIYRVKNANLQPLWERTLKLLKRLNTYEISHVRREGNAEADALARQAVRGKK